MYALIDIPLESRRKGSYLADHVRCCLRRRAIRSIALVPLEIMRLPLNSSLSSKSCRLSTEFIQALRLLKSEISFARAVSIWLFLTDTGTARVYPFFMLSFSNRQNICFSNSAKNEFKLLKGLSDDTVGDIIPLVSTKNN